MAYRFILTKNKYIWGALIGLFFFNVDAHSANIHVQSIVNIGYDDNITFRPSQEEKSLFLDTILGLGLKDTSSVHEIKFDIDIMQRIFCDTPQFNNISESGVFLYTKEFFGMDRIRLSDNFIHAEEPRSFSDFFGRRPDRYSYFLNEFDIFYEKSISKRWSLYTNYSIGMYNTDTSSINDSVIHGLDIGPVLFLGKDKDISLSYKLSIADFSNDAGRATIHSAIFGFSSPLTRAFSIDLKIGLDYIIDFVEHGYFKPAWSISFIHFVDKVSQASITLSRRFLATYYTNDIFDELKVSVYADRQVNRDTKIFISGFYGNGDYDNFEIRDKLTGGVVGLNYTSANGWQLNLSYEYSLNSSNLKDREYKRNFISVGLGKNF